MGLELENFHKSNEHLRELHCFYDQIMLGYLMTGIALVNCWANKIVARQKQLKFNTHVL